MLPPLSISQSLSAGMERNVKRNAGVNVGVAGASAGVDVWRVVADAMAATGRGCWAYQMGCRSIRSSTDSRCRFVFPLPPFAPSHIKCRTDQCSPALRAPRALALQPCSTRDFMSYLQHVEHAAENLQFYLWYRDYATRFSRAVVNVPGSVPGAQEQVGLVGFAPKWTDADQSKAEEWVAGLYAQAQARMRGRMSGTEYGDGDGDAESLPALMARRSIFAELDRLDQPAAMPDKLPGAGGAPLGIMANARSSTGGPVNPAEGDHDGDDGGGNDHHSTTGDSFADEKTADAPATFAAANPAPSLPAFNFERAEIGSKLPESPPSPLSPMSPLSAPDGYPPWICKST